MIVGERGIGKSSLLLFTNMLASGKVNWQQDNSYEYVPIQFSIDKNLNRLGLVKKVKNGLERYLQREEKLLSLFYKTWEFIKKVEVAGSKINISSKDDEQIIEEFAFSLADTCKSIMTANLLADAGLKVKKEGIILLIDEADNASSEVDLGSLLKNLSESLLACIIHERA
jgi:hypothetical protein